MQFYPRELYMSILPQKCVFCRARIPSECCYPCEIYIKEMLKSFFFHKRIEKYLIFNKYPTYR